MVNWLVIGIGDITRKRVLPAILAEPRSRLYGLLTRHPAKAEAYAGTRVFTELSAALADPQIHAVYVGTPVAMHASQAIAALQAGKHVLCEKPVALNYEEAESMASAARQSGQLLGVAYYRRLYPKLLRAKEMLAAGAIGQPTFAFAAYHGWLESPERGWLRDPALAGGGPLYDVGSHRIDVCNMLFGQPQRAAGMLSNALHDLPVEDSATARIGYDRGIQAVVDVRWNSRVTRDEFRIIGTEGELDLTPLNGSDLRLRLQGSPDSEEQHPTPTNVHLPLIEDFAAAVLDGRPLACPIDQAIRTDWVTQQVMNSPRR
ncbi:MAG: Gfo/Idh/MocA family oxidoreductase [Acidobacteriaceae bacterium]